jgi:hypothetical protein
MPARSCRVDQQRREPLHPPVHAYVIDGDAPLGQQLFDITIGQGVTALEEQRNEKSREGV